MQCGLLGRNLSHSFSPQIHMLLGEYSYQLWEIEPDQLPAFLSGNNFNALNVTVPYKKAVLPYCDQLSPLAQKIGAVNTIVRNYDGELIGYNTDYYGFTYMLQVSKLNVSHKKVLVLGSGGASATVCAALRNQNANVVIVSRSGSNHYGNLYLHSDTSVIVNTTPVGMFPNNGESLLDLARFPQLEGVLDLIYNPLRTQLLMDAENKGIVALNGLWMLIAQAKAAAELFTGHPIDDAIIPRIYNTLLKKMKNLILVGMPGSGKSTVGKLYAQSHGLSFVDSDSEIEKIIGISILEYIDNFGETSFRRLESRVLEDLSKHSGYVIATGGGCVTNADNYRFLHQNGNICWLQRDLSLLSTQGRPLSIQYGVQQLFNNRKELYERFSDYTVSNNHDLESTILQIEQMEN